MIRHFRLSWTRHSLLAAMLLPIVLVIGAGSSGSALETLHTPAAGSLRRSTADTILPARSTPVAAIDPLLGTQRYLHAIPFGETIVSVSARHRVDPLLIASVAEAESSFRADAVSPKGALGLMQVMPFHVDSDAEPFDPEVNLELGAALLAELSERFDGQLDLALAAYHAGPGAVEKYRGIPPYSSTQRYVERVLEIYLDHYAQLVRQSRG